MPHVWAEEFKRLEGRCAALEMYQKTLVEKILADDIGMVEDNVDLEKFHEVFFSAAASVEYSAAASRNNSEREEPSAIIEVRSQLSEVAAEEKMKVCHQLNKERRKWCRQKAESRTARAKISYEPSQSGPWLSTGWRRTIDQSGPPRCTDIDAKHAGMLTMMSNGNKSALTNCKG